MVDNEVNESRLSEREIVEAAIAQTERIGLGDLIIAGALFALTWLLLTLWEFPGLCPTVWDQAVVAAGVRPAVDVVPGYWTGIASIIYGIAGIGAGNVLMRLFGHLVISAAAVCVYASLRELIAFIMRARPQLSRRRTAVMRLASLIGAVAFIASEPVWTSGQILSESTVMITLTLAAFEFYLVFLRKGAIRYAYYCAMLFGLIAAESPAGIVLPIILIAAYYVVLRYIPALESPLFDPVVFEVGKWHITFLYIISFVFGIFANSYIYIANHGLGAINETVGSIPVKYVLDYLARLTSGASALGWVFLIAICVIPFVVSMIRFSEATDEDGYLRYSTGMLFFICGVLTLSQCSFLPQLWFWSYFPVKSQYLLMIGLFCVVSVLSFSFTVLGVDSFCRNHARIAGKLNAHEDESDDDGDDDELDSRHHNYNHLRAQRIVNSRSTKILRPLMVVVVVAFMIVMMMADRVQPTTRDMLEIIRDAVDEIVDEAGDAEYLITDGNLDTAIELESARRGNDLKCLSLVGGGGKMGAFLRTRGMMSKDKEDDFAFNIDVGMGLRSWIRDRPEKLKTCAALMGFDLWKRDGKPLPPMGGMLSRPTGFKSEKIREQGITNAVALANKILEVYNRRGAVKNCTNADIKKAFLALQWRIARMCIYRGEAEDLAGRSEVAIADTALANRLNDLNETYQNLIEAMEQQNRLMLTKLTPREGLQLALARADFSMGKMYADIILAADPDHPDANFAVGMYYLKARQFSRAESYLKQCLVRRPDEPAIYNNLAMIQIEIGKFDAAESNLKKALEIIPDSAEVLDTMKTLREARKRAAEAESAKQK